MCEETAVAFTKVKKVIKPIEGEDEELKAISASLDAAFSRLHRAYIKRLEVETIPHRFLISHRHHHVRRAVHELGEAIELLEGALETPAEVKVWEEEC